MLSGKIPAGALCSSYLVTDLQMKVTWFGVESQVDSVSIVSDDVLGSGVLAVASSYQLLQSNKSEPEPD